MYNIVSRCYENLSEIDFENSENKKIVSIEYFCLQVIISTVQGIRTGNP